MTKRIVIRPSAYQDLEGIYQYSIQNFGVAKAKQYIDTIDIAFGTLINDSVLTRKCDFISDGLLAHSVLSHIVFFRESVAAITIVRVLHKAMDYERHF